MAPETRLSIARKLILGAAQKQLPPEYDTERHFSPKYNPWDQRLCFCPDGDFYASIRSGKADVVTDTIKEVTGDSIELQSGEVLHPDIIVTATGLKIQVAGGAKVVFDLVVRFCLSSKLTSS